MFKMVSILLRSLITTSIVIYHLIISFFVYLLIGKGASIEYLKSVNENLDRKTRDYRLQTRHKRYKTAMLRKEFDSNFDEIMERSDVVKEAWEEGIEYEQPEDDEELYELKKSYLRHVVKINAGILEDHRDGADKSIDKR